MDRIALFPASFDPPTFGHLDIIERVYEKKMFDTLVCGIASNSVKQPLLTVETRVALLTEVTRPYDGVRVEAYFGLTVDFARRIGASTLIRGVRNTLDFEYEMQMHDANSRLCPHLDTLFVPASSKHAFISSTLIKDVWRLGGDIGELVPSAVEWELWMEKRQAHELWQEWIRVAESVGVFDPASLGRWVFRQYAPRPYHNLRHIRHCVLLGKEFGLSNEALYALFMHDVVYDPTATDNEMKSAEVAVGTGDRTMDFDKRLILVTDHVTSPQTETERLICDIDLSILGAESNIDVDEASYADYERAIRQEYAHVSDEDYRKGRAGVLRRFLERDYIYHTEQFRERFEDGARRNLKRALQHVSWDFAPRD